MNNIYNINNINMKLSITMKHVLEGINLANFLQNFWKE